MDYSNRYTNRRGQYDSSAANSANGANTTSNSSPFSRAGATANTGSAASNSHLSPRPVKKSRRTPRLSGNWLKAGSFILLYGTVILAVATIFFLTVGVPNQEGKYITKGALQAVDINVNGSNTDQVYFGHIRDLNSQYIRLTNVFYVQKGTDNTSAYNLVKLGCELHGPDDQMVINRSNVLYWENIKANSQVAQKVTEYYKQNPNGQQDCSKSGAASNGAGAATAPAATTAPATNTTKR